MELQIPVTLQFLFLPKRIKVLYGGRGGYKSVSVAKTLLFIAQREKKKILAAREFMNSIEDSVHSVFKEEIENLNMSSHYRVTDHQITGHNGTQVRYIGLARNLPSLKSRQGVDILWMEEAETVTQRSLDTVIPTIRREGSEIWITFNPDDEFGAIFCAYVKPHLDTIRSQGFYEDENLYVVKTSLDENPFATEKMLEESRVMKKDNLKKWLHIYGGEVFSDYRDSIIQPEWVEASINAHKKLGFPAEGMKVLAFDPADTGDAKAVLLRHGVVITQGFQWTYDELPEAIDIAFDRAYEWRAEQLIYDATGIGRGIKVGLKKRIEGKSIEVIGFEGAASVDLPEDIYADHKSNKDTFRNRRAQRYWNLRDRFEATFNAIEKGLYTDPDKLISISSEVEDLDVLKSELVKIQRKIGSSYIQIKSKEDMKKEGIKSPNMADTLMMLWDNKPPQTVMPTLNFTSEF